MKRDPKGSDSKAKIKAAQQKYLHCIRVQIKTDKPQLGTEKHSIIA
jgi:hypothetical protein